MDKSTNSLLKWFREKHVKANLDKCHLIVSSDESCTANINDVSIKNSTEKKKGKPEITRSCKNVTLDGLK